MNLLDRYIARQYLLNILILAFVLGAFLVLVDSAYNLDRYYSRALDWAKRDPAYDSTLARVWITITVVADLWWPRLIYLTSVLLGFILIVAMGFTVAQLVRQRELVAVLASGQSLHRIARPIFIVALGCSALSLASTELLIPRLAPKLIRDTSMAGRPALADKRLPLTADASGRVFYAAAFSLERETLTKPFIIERDPATGQATREITADTAAWRDGGWDLVNPRLGPGDPGPPPARLESTLSPLTIKVRLYQTYANTLSIAQSLWVSSQLRQTAGDQPLTESTQSQIDAMTRSAFGRIATLAANLLVLTITLCFYLTREPVNMFRQSLKCAPVGLAGLVGAALTKAAIVPGLPPIAGVLVPVAVLLPVAIAVWHRVRT